MNSTRDNKTRRARVRRPAHSSTPRYFLYPNERTDYSRRRVQKLARTRSVPGRLHTPARLDSTRESVRSRDVSTIILDSRALVDIVDSSRNLDDTSLRRETPKRVLNRDGGFCSISPRRSTTSTMDEKACFKHTYADAERALECLRVAEEIGRLKKSTITSNLRLDSSFLHALRRSRSQALSVRTSV